MTQEVERSPIQVGLVQFKPRKGDVPGNMERIRALVATDGPKHDLLVFPEACLSGYFVEGGVLELALSADQLIERLGEPSEDGPDLVLGFFERWRRGIYNSAAYLTPVGGRYQLLHVHRKLFLPTYGIFEEGRFVEPGRELQAFESRLGRMGMLICEDMWHSLPATILALGGAEILVVVSASPAREFGTGTGRPGNLDRWDLLVTPAAVEHGIFVLVSQLVGSEGGKLFPGGSLAMGPTGTVLGRGQLFEEGVTSVALQTSDIDRARFESPLLADLQGALPYLERALDQAQGKTPGSLDQNGEEDSDSTGPAAFADRREEESKEGGDAPGPQPGDLSILELDLELVERSLVEFIRDEVRGRRGFEKVVVGVSGGVDS
ncbi:MAG: NAD+ synthase, partial [Gemmatimonadetes bacterium]|nr:NAD+ synthase [Gemmatimonadota bacterium]